MSGDNGWRSDSYASAFEVQMMAITAIRNIIEINSKMDRLAAGEKKAEKPMGSVKPEEAGKPMGPVKPEEA